MGEEISWSHKEWTGFQSNLFCGNSTPLMQIPGLLKASHVPLCRLNREGIMEQIYKKAAHQE